MAKKVLTTLTFLGILASGTLQLFATTPTREQCDPYMSECEFYCHVERPLEDPVPCMLACWPEECLIYF